MSTPATQLPFLPQSLPQTQSEWQQLLNVFQTWAQAIQAQAINQTFTGGPTDVANVQYTRTANYSGGTPGFVNSVMRLTDNVSSGATADEWTLTSIMNNSATGGQNVAGYMQATKNGNVGPTWGAVVEVIESTPINNPTNGTVALEVDLDCNGTDNVGNGSRVGVDLAIRQNQANLPSSTFAQANWGYRIQNGGVVGNNVGFGFALAPGMIANVCFDSSHGTCTTAALQVATNQAIIMDGPTAQQNYLSFDGTGVRYTSGGNSQSRLNADGSIAFGGATLPVKINGTTTASANAGGGQATPATVAGYLILTINGTTVKVPYYAA